MSYIDDQLASKGVSFDKIVEDILIFISPVYMKPAVMKEESYQIPTRLDSDYDYCEIPFAKRIVTNIYDAVPAKSHYADFKGLRTARHNDDSLEDKNSFVFGWHGRHMLVNNTDVDTTIRVKFAEVPKEAESLHEEIYRALKQCYYYSMIEDWNGLYSSMDNLSKAKYNAVQKNIHTERSRRPTQYHSIKLFKI